MKPTVRLLAVALAVLAIGCNQAGSGSSTAAGASTATTPATTTPAATQPAAPPPPPPPAPAVASSPVGGPTDPSQPGPYSTTRVNLPVMTAGQTTYIDLHMPVATVGPRPTVIINHGWLTTTALYQSLAEHLASRGFAAALFQQPEVLDTSTGDWSVQLRGGIDALTNANAPGGAVSGQLDLTKLGAMGHSYGGATVIWAAADDPRIKVVVALAPVNQPNFAALLTHSSQLTVPLLVLAGQDDPLSIPGTYTRPIYDAATGVPAKLYCEYAGGNHLDFCDLGQGSGQYTFSEQYQTAWLEHFLAGLPDTGGWTDGTRAAQDLAAGTLSYTY
jgi:predicted dienelactone hydrolase